MAAGIATLQQINETDYLKRLTSAGQLLRKGLDAQARTHGFALRQTGPAQMPQILFHDDPDFRIGYAWTAECLKHGAYFHPFHNMFLSAAHTPADIDRALEASDRAFEFVRRKRDTLAPPEQLAHFFEMLAHA
ncbi:hypothetical protein [Variovorax sp. W2I14]|uniref:hypothetical protein n=1 Tax=Variovorax sp. W2I14 TaxID=3042290 RepID=UPI003D199D9B